MSVLHSCSFRILPITWVLPDNTGQVLFQIYIKKVISQDCWHFSCVPNTSSFYFVILILFVPCPTLTTFAVKVQVLPGIPTKSARCFIDGISVNPPNDCIYWRNWNLEVSHLVITPESILCFSVTQRAKGFLGLVSLELVPDLGLILGTISPLASQGSFPIV